MVIKRGKGAQVTIFIIVAVIIVAAVGGYFIFKDSIDKTVVTTPISPIETSFLSCLEGKLETGILLLESQGGYIFETEFEPGSEYMPFSSHLNFIGTEIPYWSYVSASNFPRENVPSLEFMESELEKFVENNIHSCSFEKFYDQGYSIKEGVPEAEVRIRDSKVDLDLNSDLIVSKGEENFIVKKHFVEVKSQLGILYEDAVEFYDYEKDNLILENYSMDVLRLYAPVDGVEFSCSPLIWNADEVFNDLRNALQDNILSLKNFGDSKDYFDLKIPIDSDLRLLTMADWPMTLEVDSAKGNLLISEPVGNQAGLGILGFCYVPYHYVYNLRYPVLIQVYKGNELFQFPIAVLIEKNSPYKKATQNIGILKTPEICEFSNSFVEVSLYDNNLKPVEGYVSYECLGDTCSLGSTTNGVLEAYVPQCVNGNFIIRSDGFSELISSYTSTLNGSFIGILEKIYEKEINLELDNGASFDSAIISFTSEDFSETVVYPEDKFASLKQGEYEASVSVFGKAELVFEETTQEECVDVVTGIGSIFGITKKECFETIVPKQTIDQVLSGAGTGEYFFLESELEENNIINIVAKGFETPESIEKLSENYALADLASLEVTIL